MEKNDKLDRLKQQREQLNARIQNIEAAEKSREKKKDTRRKILIGAYHLNSAKENGNFDELVRLMDGYLKRNSDRILFNLAPLEPKK